MGSARLTRQELGWLLAQEARGAARVLREEVTELRASHRPAAGEFDSAPKAPSLDALDGAIHLLTALQSGAKPRRRSRVDIASLLVELAPHWRITLQPGAGTEVLGDEADFRRILQVLLTQAGAPSDTLATADSATRSMVRVVRDGSWVRIDADLGADTTATSEIERRWLARMAMRYGGRYELHGKGQRLSFRAETDAEEELNALRSELEQAKRLGETYAQELGTFLSAVTAQANQPSEPEPIDHQALFRLLIGLSRRVHAELAEMSSAPPRGGLLEMLASLTGPGTSPATATSEDEAVDLTALLATLVGSLPPTTASRVQLIPAEAAVPALRLPRVRVESLVRLLVHHALDASQGESIELRVKETHGGRRIQLDVLDRGPRVSPDRRTQLLTLQVDPTTLERPDGPELLLAFVIASSLQAQLDILSTDPGGCLVRVMLPTTLERPSPAA